MTATITKDDLCWVLVKLTGVVLLYSAFTQIYSLFSMELVTDEFIGAGLEDRTGFKSIQLTLTFLAACPGALLGTYLLVSGRLMHRILMMVPVPSTVGSSLYYEDRMKQSLGDDYDEFKSWISDNPKHADRAPIDQIALFRDSRNPSD